MHLDALLISIAKSKTALALADNIFHVQDLSFNCILTLK